MCVCVECWSHTHTYRLVYIAADRLTDDSVFTLLPIHSTFDAFTAAEINTLAIVRLIRISLFGEKKKLLIAVLKFVLYQNIW